MLRTFIDDESGQGMTEYILIVALLAIAAIAVLKVFGKSIKDLFSGSANKIQSEGQNAISGR